MAASALYLVVSGALATAVALVAAVVCLDLEDLVGLAATHPHEKEALSSPICLCHRPQFLGDFSVAEAAADHHH